MARRTIFFFSFWGFAFLLFSYWQFNDPDPQVWVTIYSLAALMCILAAFGRFFLPVLFVMSIGALIGGIYLFPPSVTEWIISEWQQADLSMKTIDMERARESFGLLIVSVIMSTTAYIGWQQKTKAGLKKR